LNGAEVVGVIASLSAGEITVHKDRVTTEETIADPITIEQPSQEELQGVTHTVSLASELAKINSEALKLAVVTDEFDINTFDENVDTEQHVEKDDETGRSKSDEELSGVTPVDVTTSSRIDWGSYYTDEELRALKLKHITLEDYLNHKDMSQIGSALCDSVVVDDEVNPRVQEKVIKKGQMFKTLDAMKLFFQDYAVHHHRPYYVVKLNKNVRYIIKCQILSCSWGVWIRHTKNEIHQWKVCTVKQPHTCGTSEVRHVHPQCTARFLGRRITSIVWAQSDITVAALIKVIHGLTIYRVRYGKPWRAKEHALSLLWGDWKESYTKVSRLLNVISYFNPCTRCIIDSCDQWLPNEKGQYYPVLKCVFWCFLQCVAGFAHCRPIVSVDATFLTGYITYYLVLPIKESFTYTKYYNHNKIYNICRFTNSAR
jgi:hypothetical protein